MYKAPYRGNIRGSGQRGLKSRASKILKQIAISLLILAVLLSLSSVKVSFVDNMMGYVKKGLAYDYTIEDGVSGIKYVFKKIPVYRNKVASVFKEMEITNTKQKMIMPADGPITSKFGKRVHPVFNDIRVHQGIDIGVKEGTPIKAAMGGTVEKTDFDNELGNYILIKHSDRLKTLYAHLSESTVKVNDKVKQSRIIGKAGATGLATSPHLHFEVWENEKAVDPMTMLEDKSDRQKIIN